MEEVRRVSAALARARTSKGAVEAEVHGLRAALVEAEARIAVAATAAAAAAAADAGAAAGADAAGGNKSGRAYHGDMAVLDLVLQNVDEAEAWLMRIAEDAARVGAWEVLFDATMG
jgi:hypothetical protein